MNFKDKLVTDEAVFDAVIDILKLDADLKEDQNNINHSLKLYFLEDNSFPKEYRLNSNLGFGGKLRQSSPYSNLYVTAYSEDITPKLEKTINEINKKILSCYPH